MTTRTSYKPINSYGIIGNCQSAALVGLDGSIDWCCFPRFDSPSAFAAILDGQKGGRFAITLQGAYNSTQQYVGDTNVLETRFETQDAICTLTDCMPINCEDGGVPVPLNQVIRVVRCQQGDVTLQVDYAPRPNYARASVHLEEAGGAVVWSGQGQGLTLQAPIALDLHGDRAQGTITLAAGEEATFVLSYRDATTSPGPIGLTPQERVARTLAYWESKVSEIDYQGPWRQQMVRSYLALHLLFHLPTGSIVAAATTSLPEEIGGVRNWDYRYTWLRDAAFTIDALMTLGHLDEAITFFRWLCQVCIRCGDDLHIMYRVDLKSDLEEEVLPHLEGYQRSRPVRVGNGAHKQVQHDIYGEVLASAYLLATHGEVIDDSLWDLLYSMADLAATRWQEPDSGIWEVRGGPHHFVYSKVMCWVALDRAIALALRLGRAGTQIEMWQRAALAIKEEVLRRGWSEEKQAFVQHYDTDALDASALLMPIVGFLPFDDPRVISTVRHIRQELGDGPFLQRYHADDGLPGEEGAFTLCSFWLVRVLARMGEPEEARRMMGQLLDCANHLGLFSEMVDPHTGAALGNFPQAFTHLGLILAARECQRE